MLIAWARRFAAGPCRQTRCYRPIRAAAGKADNAATTVAVAAIAVRMVFGISTLPLLWHTFSTLKRPPKLLVKERAAANIAPGRRNGTGKAIFVGKNYGKCKFPPMFIQETTYYCHPLHRTGYRITLR